MASQPTPASAQPTGALPSSATTTNASANSGAAGPDGSLALALGIGAAVLALVVALAVVVAVHIRRRRRAAASTGSKSTLLSSSSSSLRGSFRCTDDFLDVRSVSDLAERLTVVTTTGTPPPASRHAALSSPLAPIDVQLELPASEPSLGLQLDAKEFAATRRVVVQRVVPGKPLWLLDRVCAGDHLLQVNGADVQVDGDWASVLAQVSQGRLHAQAAGVPLALVFGRPDSV